MEISTHYRTPTDAASKCHLVFDGAFFTLFSHPYDISPDGERFLMITAGPSAEGADRNALVLVQNWFDELNRLAPRD